MSEYFGVQSIQEFNNPTLVSPYSPYGLPFFQTRESLMDGETYQKFLHNVVSQVRKSRFYTNYKGFLYNVGLDHCQILGNVTSDMATLEMHHNVLTIFDIALIITEHLLNTIGYVTTFDIEEEIVDVHKNHNVQLVMLCKTAHELFHDNPEFFISPSMCIGDWIGFLNKYKYGITQDIAYKILYYIQEAIEHGPIDNDLLDLKDTISDWSGINDVQYSVGAFSDRLPIANSALISNL